MITSVHNETIKNIMKLKQKKYRDERQLFLVEGYHLVEEAIKFGYVKQVIALEEKQYDVETLIVSSSIMEKLAFTKTPQPIMAICYKKEVIQLDFTKTRYLLLNRVQDPGNVGTIIRTALALGVDHIIMSQDCVDLYNDKVVRSTQGSLFQMNITMMDLKDAIQLFHDNGIPVYGTSLKNAQPLNQCCHHHQMAFVMGNEGQGVSQDILDLCDQNIYIPIENIDSLNVGIATAIILHHFRDAIIEKK